MPPLFRIAERFIPGPAFAGVRAAVLGLFAAVFFMFFAAAIRFALAASSAFFFASAAFVAAAALAFCFAAAASALFCASAFRLSAAFCAALTDPAVNFAPIMVTGDERTTEDCDGRSVELGAKADTATMVIDMMQTRSIVGRDPSVVWEVLILRGPIFNCAHGMTYCTVMYCFSRTKMAPKRHSGESCVFQHFAEKPVSEPTHAAYSSRYSGCLARAPVDADLRAKCSRKADLSRFVAADFPHPAQERDGAGVPSFAL